MSLATDGNETGVREGSYEPTRAECENRDFRTRYESLPGAYRTGAYPRLVEFNRYVQKTIHFDDLRSQYVVFSVMSNTYVPASTPSNRKKPLGLIFTSRSPFPAIGTSLPQRSRPVLPCC